jgi:hypothetical protein
MSQIRSFANGAAKILAHNTFSFTGVIVLLLVGYCLAGAFYNTVKAPLEPVHVATKEEVSFEAKMDAVTKMAFDAAVKATRCQVALEAADAGFEHKEMKLPLEMPASKNDEEAMVALAVTLGYTASSKAQAHEVIRAQLGCKL